jgi:hypothetical protein
LIITNANSMERMRRTLKRSVWKYCGDAMASLVITNGPGPSGSRSVRRYFTGTPSGGPSFPCAVGPSTNSPSEGNAWPTSSAEPSTATRSTSSITASSTPGVQEMVSDRPASFRESLTETSAGSSARDVAGRSIVAASAARAKRINSR